MNKLKPLILLQIKDFIGKMQSSLNIRNRILARLLQSFVIIALAVPAVNYAIFTYKVFDSLQRPELVMTTMYIGAVMLTFFLGIPIIISVFFFSKDLRFLSALPLREDTIVFAKLSTVYIYMLAVTTILLAPGMIVYGINTGFSISLIIFGLLALILAPVLPLFISAIVVLIFSRIISKNKYRNIFIIIGNILFIVVIIALQMGMNRFAANPEEIKTIFSTENGLLRFIGIRFPPSIWLTKMILGSLKDAVYFIGLNAIFFFIIKFLAGLFFRRSLLAFGQGSIAAGKIYYKKHSKGWQLFRRHILIIVKEPTFLINTLLSMIIPVIMFLVMSVSGQISLEMFASEQLKPYLILIFSGILISPAVVSNISSTAITREGRAFWETKVLPVEGRENIKYRVLTTAVINLLGVLVLSIISLYLLPLTLKIIIIAVILAISTTLFLGTVDFIINIYRPLLNWTHPTAAVKNNMNVIISLGIRAVIGLIYYGLYKIS